jgi:site-specific recombinase XerD
MKRIIKENALSEGVSPKFEQCCKIAPPVVRTGLFEKRNIKQDKIKAESLLRYKDESNLMKIHPEGKIDAKRYPTFEDVLDRLDSNKDNFLPDNRIIIRRFVYDARLGKTVIGKQKKKIGVKRIQKYLQDLKKLDDYFKKPLDSLTSEDMERFILDLEEGRVKTAKGSAYALETQAVIKKLIKKFYKWLWGNNRIFPEIVEWIDTSVEVQDYSALRKEEIDKMVGMIISSKSEIMIRNRALIMVLFDAGLRAEEMLNVRLKHIYFEGENYKMRVEYSKTKKRTITLPMCKCFLDDWLDVHPMRTESEAQLFPMTYDNLRMAIKRSGAVIKAEITPHSLRHSSATYWCQHLTPYELCYRLGWSMSSKMPQRYIDREGLYQEKAEKIIKATNMTRLEEENAKLNRRLASMEDQMNKLLGKDYDEARKIVQIVKQELMK